MTLFYFTKITSNTIMIAVTGAQLSSVAIISCTIAGITAMRSMTDETSLSQSSNLYYMRTSAFNSNSESGDGNSKTYKLPVRKCEAMSTDPLENRKL